MAEENPKKQNNNPAKRNKIASEFAVGKSLNSENTANTMYNEKREMMVAKK